jgi:hypothetical protein
MWRLLSEALEPAPVESKPSQRRKRRVTMTELLKVWEKKGLVELSGIEPLTSSLRTTRSPN